MGAIVIRTRYDEGTESAEVATSAPILCRNTHLAIAIYYFRFDGFFQ
jgi:hypothetical protein